MKNTVRSITRSIGGLQCTSINWEPIKTSVGVPKSEDEAPMGEGGGGVFGGGGRGEGGGGLGLGGGGDWL